MMKRILLSLLAFVVLLLALAPTILSVNRSKEWLLSIINSQSENKITIESMSAGWFSGVTLNTIEVTDRKQRSIFSCKQIALTESLFSLLTGRISLNCIKPVVSIYETQEEISKKKHSRKKRKSESESSTIFFPLRAAFTVENGTVILIQDDQELARLQELHCNLTTNHLREFLLTSQANVVNSGKLGHFMLKAHVKELQNVEALYAANFLGKKVFFRDKPEVRFGCTMEQFPVQLLDTLLALSNPELEDVVRTSIGETLDCSIVHECYVDTMTTNVAIKSQNLNSAIQVRINGNQLQIAPSTIDWQIVPDFIAALPSPIEYHLMNPTVLSFALGKTEITLPLIQETNKAPFAISLALDSPLLLQNEDKSKTVSFDLSGSIQAEDIEELIKCNIAIGAISGKEQAKATFALSLADVFTPDINLKAAFEITGDPWPFAIFTNVPVANIEAMTGPAEKFELLFEQDAKQIVAACNIQAAKVNFSSTCTAIQTSKRSWDIIAKATSDLSKTTMFGTEFVFDAQAVVVKRNNRLRLELNKCTLNSEILSAAFVLNPIPDLKNISHLKGIFKIPELKLSYKQDKIGIFECTMPFQIEVEPEFKLTSSIDIESSDSSAEFNGTLNLQTKEFKISTTGNFDEFPIEAIETVVHNSQLDKVVGPTVSGSWNLEYFGPKSKHNLLFATFKSKTITGEVALNLHDGVLMNASEKPAFAFTCNMTPGMFSSLARTDKIDLLKSATWHCTCSRLQLPLQLLIDAQKESKDKVAIAMQFSSDPLRLQEQDGDSYSLPALNGTVLMEAGTGEFSFAVNSADPASETKITLSGKTENILNEYGLQFADATYTVDCEVEKFPLVFLRSFIKDDGSRTFLRAFFGNFGHVKLHGSMTGISSGTFDSEIKTDYLIVPDCSIAITNGVLTLQRPIAAQLAVTPTTGEILLYEIRDVFNAGMTSTDPVTIFVSHQDFSIPLKDYAFEKVQIGSIKIDLGKLRVRKGRVFELITMMLNMKSGPFMEMWFTPVYLEVKKGVVTCKRVDALIDGDVQVLIWGTVDVLQDEVDMVIGVLGSGLRKALLLLTVDPNYVLQMPLRGTLRDFSIDKARATAKIAGLRIRESINPTQIIFGNVLGAVASIGEQDESVPPPTTQPFPWDSQ